MNDATQLRKLMESLDQFSSTLYVYDNGNVTELDTSNNLAMQQFSNQYGFHSDSLNDIPVERGVQVFQSNNRTIIVSADPVALSAEVEARQ